ncbi:uncharacterized protein LOC133793885 [Humulus lupulus]|uniref:uncharacterized protein LOC133793885 n=1 Tax=Humulus lupulus TaxID=3486 RepID=UPI002B4008F5|nr:uncharacterized protein LOC133793885 [Humulus lupulus]
MEKPEGYPEPEVVDQEEDDRTSSVDWFRPGAKDDMSLLESGILGKYYQTQITGDHHEDYYYNFESRFGILSDPRLLAVVEFFRELYFRRRELFTKTFPQLHDDDHHHHIFEVLKNSGTKLWRVKSGDDIQTRAVSLQRSSSLGSPRSRPAGTRGIESPLRNEWIKVKTLNTGGGETKSGGGGSK